MLVYQPPSWVISTPKPLSQVFHSAPSSSQGIHSLVIGNSYVFIWDGRRFEGEVRQVVSVQFRRVLVEVGLPAWCISFVLVLANNQLEWSVGVSWRHILRSYLFPDFPRDGTFKTPGASPVYMIFIARLTLRVVCLACYVHSGALARAIVNYPERGVDEDCYHDIVADQYCSAKSCRHLRTSSDLRFACKLVETVVTPDTPRSVALDINDSVLDLKATDEGSAVWSEKEVVEVRV